MEKKVIYKRPDFVIWLKENCCEDSISVERYDGELYYIYFHYRGKYNYRSIAYWKVLEKTLKIFNDAYNEEFVILLEEYIKKYEEWSKDEIKFIVESPQIATYDIDNISIELSNKLSRIREMNICEYCGSGIKNGWTNCKKCGAPKG